MAEQETRISPLAHYTSEFGALTGSESVEISEVPFLTQLTLRVAPGSSAAELVEGVIGCELPVAPNTTAATDEVTLLWLGPDEWLVLAAADAADDLVARIGAVLADERGAVVDTSAQRTTIRLKGKHARDVLAHGTSIDLHPKVFGAGRCAQTVMASTQVVIVAEDDGYLVLVRSSFAHHLAAWLLDASTEYISGSAEELARGTA